MSDSCVGAAKADISRLFCRAATVQVWMNLRPAIIASALPLLLLSASLPARDLGRVVPSVNARAQYRELVRPREVPDDKALEAAGAIVGRVDIDVGNVFDTAD